MKTRKKQLSPQLIKLLRKTREFILRHPRRFDQHMDDRLTCSVKECQAPQCIIGWLRIIYRGKGSVNDLFPSDIERERLYYASYWPAQFKLPGEYSTFDWHGITAKTAAKRITHFIKTDGRE